MTSVIEMTLKISRPIDNSVAKGSSTPRRSQPDRNYKARTFGGRTVDELLRRTASCFANSHRAQSSPLSNCWKYGVNAESPQKT